MPCPEGENPYDLQSFRLVNNKVVYRCITFSRTESPQATLQGAVRNSNHGHGLF